MAQLSFFFGRPFPEAEGAFVEVLAGRLTIHHLDTFVVIDDELVGVAGEHRDHSVGFKKIEQLLPLGGLDVVVAFLLIGLFDKERVVRHDNDRATFFLG